MQIHLKRGGVRSDSMEEGEETTCKALHDLTSEIPPMSPSLFVLQTHQPPCHSPHTWHRPTPHCAAPLNTPVWLPVPPPSQFCSSITWLQKLPLTHSLLLFMLNLSLENESSPNPLHGCFVCLFIVWVLPLGWKLQQEFLSLVLKLTCIEEFV